MVTKGLDTLVIEPSRAPAEYAHETWSKPSQSWLSWTADPKQDRQKKPRILCHVFTERPIYRPEEPVHVKGYVRCYLGGKLSYASGGGAAVIKGPGKQEWRIPVKLDERGRFYFKFDQPTPATGNYSVRFEADGAKPPAKQAEAGPARTAGDRPAGRTGRRTRRARTRMASARYRKRRGGGRRRPGARGRSQRRGRWHILRRLSVQEGGLPAANLRGGAEQPRAGSARWRVQHRSFGALFRGRPCGRAASQMAGGAISLCVDASRARRLRLFERFPFLG